MSAKPWSLRAFGSPPAPLAGAGDVVEAGVLPAGVVVRFFAADAVLAAPVRCFFAPPVVAVAAVVRCAVELEPPRPVSAIAATAPAASSSAARAASAGQRRGPGASETGGDGGGVGGRRTCAS